MRLRYMSPLSLPRISRHEVQDAAQPGVYVEPPGADRPLLRYAPEFIDDPSGAGVFDGLGDAAYVSPPVFLTTLPRPTLFGYRALAWDGRFCTDAAGTPSAETGRFLDGLSSPEPFPNEDTGLVAAPGGDGFDLPCGSRPQRHHAGAAAVLCSHEPLNYGSFLFRVLPKLHAIRAHGLGHLPVVAWAHTPAFLELLRLAGVPASQVVQHDTGALVTFDRVIAPSLRNPHAFLDPESHAFFQNMARENPGTGGGRRLYVSRLGLGRRGVSTRQMLNEAEVAAAMAGLGFEVIEPEGCSPTEQIAAFASADVIMGPAGSGLFNVVFCRPGTKVVDIESEPNWIYAHTGLFASCKARYGLFVAAVDQSDPAPVHKRFSVDVPALVARVAKFLRS